ncbi:MAG: phosphohydrolase [Oscillospiraceae bacterium]|nr:phosphohydrolase [Oscillospiraceae bacterium]
MHHIVTHMGQCFTPLEPEIDKILIEDIAHSLSLLCRANGHIDRFYSIAQHSISCVYEAKARGYSARVQLACLIHDGSEAYISDITRPVKMYLPEYKIIEKRLQDTIYTKYLGVPLTEDEFLVVDEIDGNILICEFHALSRNRELVGAYKTPIPVLKSSPSFETRPTEEVETEFLKVYYGVMHAGIIQGR